MRLISAHIRVLGVAYVHLWFPAPDAAVGSDAVVDADPAVGATTAARRAFLPNVHLHMSNDHTSGRRPSTRRWRRHQTRCRSPVTRLHSTFQKSLSILGELSECPQLTDSPHFFIKRGPIPRDSNFEGTVYRPCPT